ncbi:MAG: DUF1287 domain-containing protein [Sphingobacteriia bacterium]|nr:MAG: DUF1287 domain-containing protein [Sphingobacteriia bacterium]
MRDKRFLLFCFLANAQDKFSIQLCNAAKELTAQKVQYDPSYYTISYPMGDVPSNKGVCADVIIRAYRKLGIDLQQLVHEDMSRQFSTYPKNWGLQKTDKNIDHRRVPNLMKYFDRYGKNSPISLNEKDYQPGDIVCWLINNKLPHIGIVVDVRSSLSNRYLIVHNVGEGQVMEDCLFKYPIIGHYVFKPK